MACFDGNSRSRSRFSRKELEHRAVRIIGLKLSRGRCQRPNASMPPRILTYELQQQYEALRALLQRALWLAERCADFEATQILRSRLTNLQSPALLVIVGEVKTGKSSFINALVQEEVCDVAPGPCTTRIQELVYGA